MYFVLFNCSTPAVLVAEILVCFEHSDFFEEFSNG
jgi:hypothetical protein